MKWFKHYGNASTNQFLQALLREKNGHSLYAKWFLLLEFLCLEFKKDTIEFTASSRQLMAALYIGQHAKLSKDLETFQKLSAKFDESLLEVSETSEKVFKIKTPIVLELMGKDFKRTRQCRGSATAKKKEERIKNNIHAHFDFEAVYQKYPLKKGKSRGMKKIQREIKKPVDFERFSKAVDNYANEVKNTEPRYIKHFSTFVSEWTDWVDQQHTTLNLQEARDFLGSGAIND